MSQAEEEEKHIPLQMTKDNIKSGLSQIGKTFDGSSVAYIKLELENKELDIVSDELKNYRHLRYVNLSGNHFDSIQVMSELPYILKLELRGNRINSLEVFNNASNFHYLQVLDLSKNMIQALTALHVPKLVNLKLSNNLIADIRNFQGHSSLKVIDLRGNKLKSLAGLHSIPTLEELWLAENTITSLTGLKDLPNLKKIHLRKNAFNAIDHSSLPELPSLAYLNFRENEIVDPGVFAGLRIYKSLSKLVVTDNPIKPEPSGDLKKEVLISLPQIRFIGKEEVQAEEREDAINEAAERKRLAEEARKEAERAAKEALENGENKEAEEDS